jgi:hypothetical protein
MNKVDAGGQVLNLDKGRLLKDAGVIHKKVGPARFKIFSIGWRYC